MKINNFGNSNTNNFESNTGRLIQVTTAGTDNG